MRLPPQPTEDAMKNVLDTFLKSVAAAILFTIAMTVVNAIRGELQIEDSVRTGVKFLVFFFLILLAVNFVRTRKST